LRRNKTVRPSCAPMRKGTEKSVPLPSKDMTLREKVIRTEIKEKKEENSFFPKGN